MEKDTLVDRETTLREEIFFMKKENDFLKKQLDIMKQRDIFENAGDAMIIFDNKGILFNANRQFCSLVDKEERELIGVALEEFVPLDKRYKLKRQQFLLDQSGRAKGILPIKHKKGISIFEIVTKFNEKIGLNVSILRDITHKQTLEENIKKSENLLQELFLEALDGIIFWDLNGKILNVNAAACRILERNSHELIGSKVAELKMDPNKNPLFFQRLQDLISLGAVRDEVFIIMPDGKEKLLEYTGRMHSVDGFHMTIFRDISERNRMENELRESEGKFRVLFEEALDGMILLDNHKRIIDANGAAEKILCIPKKDLVEQSLHTIMAGCSLETKELLKNIENVKEKGKNSSSISILCENGRRKHYEISTQNELAKGLNLTVFRDVSEKIQMQEQLRKSDTLNVIGELAAGIAHEVRNPMTALKGFIQLLEGSIKPEHSMYYQIINSELQRIDSIINEFLILAKPQAVRFQEKNVVQIMTETLELLNAQAVLNNVQFNMKTEEDLYEIFCEPNQLKKVFINIIKNAIEVMPDGGYITVKIEKQGEKIHISIEDEGEGIPAEKLKKLGEPFYTTKERGTGLGLMVSFRIIEEHNGLIIAESEEGKGSVFHIYLPLHTSKEVLI